MSQFTFSVAAGRVTELYARVDGNDPANSALILVVLAAAGLESDSVLKAKDTLADVLSGTTNEVTNASYSRKVLTDASLSAYTVDDDLGQIVLPLPTQTFSAIAVGDLWRKLLVCYDGDTTAGTDANIIPITAHDLLIDGVAVTPTGDNIVISAPTGFAIAR